MNYRLATLTDRETADTAATKLIDINLVEPITALSIQMRGTNNSYTPTAHPAKMVSKIELVDGSDVLASLSGIECQALELFDTGRQCYTELNYVLDQTAIAVFEMRFGRQLWDEQLALDPKKFTNLQLKITHNKAAGGSAPDAGQLSVLAHVFDEKAISPMGFLSNKEHYTYTLTASAHEYIDLPTDHPVRKLIIQSLYTGLQPWENYNKIKLFSDEQKKVFINNLRTSDLLRCYANDVNPYFTECVRIYNDTNAATAYITSTFDSKIVWAPFLGTDSGYQGLASYGGTFTMDCSAAAEGDCIVRGKAPHGAFCIPMGKQDIIADWFDPKRVGSWKLDLTAGGSANGTVEIVLQQMRRY